MAIIWVSLQNWDVGLLQLWDISMSPCFYCWHDGVLLHVPPKKQYVDSCLWLTSLAGSTPPLPSVHSKNSCEHEEPQGFPQKLLWIHQMCGIYCIIYLGNQVDMVPTCYHIYIYTYYMSNINRYHISITSYHTIIQYWKTRNVFLWLAIAEGRSACVPGTACGGSLASSGTQGTPSHHPSISIGFSIGFSIGLSSLW